jgi:hypothetical protein
VKGIQDFQRGDNHKNVKMGWGHLKIFSRTTGPILTRLGTKHPWRERIQVSLKEEDSPSLKGDNNTNHPCVKGIQVCSKERDSPFPRGDNSERVKMH